MSADPEAAGYTHTMRCKPYVFCDLRSAIVLLDHGHVDPAARLLENAFRRSLPLAMWDSYLQGRVDAVTELAEALAGRRVREPPRRSTRDVRILAEAVLAVGVDPVLAALKIDPPDLLRLVGGRATLAASQRKALRALLGGTDGPPLGPADSSSKSDTEVPF